MKKRFSIATVAAVTSLPAMAGSFSVGTERATFEAALATPFMVEGVTDSNHLPIPSGVLNSATSLPDIGIAPGDIQPGATCSTPSGAGNFFNIDAGGDFAGGFLDGFYSGDGNGTLAFALDNFMFAAAVPEPGSVALMLPGLGGVAAAVRRRRA